MNDLDRIERALETQRLDSGLFERCAQDMLSELYPGLTPIPGGTDWGRDGDVAATGEQVPPRLVATTSRTLDGIRDNMRRGIRSMEQHGVAVGRLILANPAGLSLLERRKLVESAARAGALLDVSEVFDRGFFGSRLRRDGYWRQRLLGLPSEPISLSRMAPDVAESGWGFLPLVARDEDLAAIRAAGDLILTGPPGVGKSRVAGELEDAVFVDTDAEWSQIAGDLRWADPRVVIVDDARGQEQLIRRLSGLRRTEGDVFDFRLVAVCWPEELEALQAVMPGAMVHKVDLVERGPINDLLLHMGITGRLARAEILDQAEGRPGWAVALGDLLLRARDVASLRRGKALFGQVDRYLRRAGIQVQAMDLLAIVAALGSVSERELHDVGEEAGLSRADTAAIIESAARGGLIDVVKRYGLAEDRLLRVFAVRPPMLADVLVAERLIARTVPIVGVEELEDRWPDRIDSLTMAVIRAVELGNGEASDLAKRLFDRALASDDVDHSTASSVAQAFLRLGEKSADYVMRIARQSFDEVTADGHVDSWRVGSVVPLAARAARWYHSRAAFTLLFDACVVDTRPTNPYPDHPLRQIEDLVTDFHPKCSARASFDTNSPTP